MKSRAERRALLDQALSEEKRKGWRVEWESDDEALLVKKRWLDRLLLGMDPMLLLAPRGTFARGTQRRLVRVDEAGNVAIEPAESAPL